MDIGTIAVIAVLVGLFVGAAVWMEMQSRRNRGRQPGSDKVSNEK